MATNPFAGAGLGMFGQELADLPSPEKLKEGEASPLGLLVGLLMSGKKPVAPDMAQKTAISPTGYGNPTFKLNASPTGLSPMIGGGLSMYNQPNLQQPSVNQVSDFSVNDELWGGKK
jgi:hypothetical protein